ncbi:MAG TPA: DUF1697 domain-containing protein [Paenisporosarcina sp.]|nr:DUF1697 domain-containing protein [Paenisporosarcina sp.]
MTIYIALLRGINVGGHNIIKMADLKQLLETMGLTNVQTYIQSGNIVFESEAESDELSQRIEQQIKDTFGFSVPVILRTSKEWKKMIDNCPYSVETLVDGESVHVTLLSEKPSQEALTKLQNFPSGVDQYDVQDKDIYLFLRQNFRDSKLPLQLQKLGVSATIRNWKTTMKLAAMIKTME